MDERSMAARVAEAWHPPPMGSTAVFLVIVLAVVVLFTWGVIHTADPAKRRRDGAIAVCGLAGYMALWAAAMLSDALAYDGLPVPTLMPVIGGTTLLMVAAAFSPLGRRLALGVPVAWLIAAQGLRLPLELVLHAWHDSGTIPVQMTFEGHNFDIVSGVLGVLVGVAAAFGRASRGLLLTANVVGTLLLGVVMLVAVLSSPVPFQAYPDPPLVLAFRFPYGWILPMCVGAALFAHLVAFRALLRRPDREVS